MKQLTEDQRTLVVEHLGVARGAAAAVARRTRRFADYPDLLGWSYLALCRAAAYYRPDRSNRFDGYAYMLCRQSVWREAHRYKSVNPVDPESLWGAAADAPGIDDVVCEAELREQLRDAIADLPRQQRRAMDLWYGGLTNREISARMGLDKTTVSFHCSAAIRALRKRFGV